MLHLIPLILLALIGCSRSTAPDQISLSFQSSLADPQTPRDVQAIGGDNQIEVLGTFEAPGGGFKLRADLVPFKSPFCGPDFSRPASEPGHPDRKRRTRRGSRGSADSDRARAVVLRRSWSPPQRKAICNLTCTTLRAGGSGTSMQARSGRDRRSCAGMEPSAMDRRRRAESTGIGCAQAPASSRGAS